MLNEKAILYFLFAAGVLFFFYSLRKPPIKDWLLAFFITGYFALILGVTVVESGMLSYPVTIFPYFDSSPLFELVLFPVLSLHYYQTTYHYSFKGYLMKGFLYTTILTVIEFFLEKYTELIHYISWKWYYTFISVYVFFVLIRCLLQLISKQPNHEQKETS